MFNTEAEKSVLVESLRRAGDPDAVVECLEYILEHHTPFALYVATADRSSCMWIFDPDTVYEMLGGEDIHDKTFRSVFTDDIERGQGILFYVLRKVGPAMVIRLSDTSLRDVLESLGTSR